MNKKETETRGEAKGTPLTIKGRRVSKDYLIEHGIIKDYFTPSKKEKSENCIYIDTIYRQDAIEAICKACSMEEDYHRCDGYPETSTWCDELVALRALPPAQSTLYGYNIEHLELIAKILQKENLPPERVAEALTDINRIVDIVRDEFEETLRKAVEQCTI